MNELNPRRSAESTPAGRRIIAGSRGPDDGQFTKPGGFYYGCLILGYFEARMLGKVVVR